MSGGKRIYNSAENAGPPPANEAVVAWGSLLRTVFSEGGSVARAQKTKWISSTPLRLTMALNSLPPNTVKSAIASQCQRR